MNEKLNILYKNPIINSLLKNDAFIYGSFVRNYLFSDKDEKNLFMDNFENTPSLGS